MPYKFKFGDKVLIRTINEEKFEGDITFCGEDSFGLRNIKDLNKNIPLQGIVMTLYRMEIASVRVLYEAETKEDLGTDDKNSDKYIKIPKCKFENLQKLTQNFKYIDKFDDHYDKALDHIRNSETLGIVKLGDPSNLSISLLVVSSWDQIYLFDLNLYKEFPKELQFIFVNKDIKKVMHDSKALVSSLNNHYKIKINNVFDTQVADIIIQEKENLENIESRSIGECLKQYFNFPEKFLARAMEAEKRNWDKRPLAESSKVNASQLAAYLITLKVHMENLLLEDFYTRAYEYSRSTVNIRAACLNFDLLK